MDKLIMDSAISSLWSNTLEYCGKLMDKSWKMISYIYS